MYKILKQELLFIPIMLLIVEIFRHAVIAFYPETALFDRGSEFETFLFRVWQIVWITSATWLLMRVVYPAAHKSLVKYYTDFDTYRYAEEDRRKFSLKMFLVFFLALVLLLSGKASNEPNYRKKLCDTLESQLHVRELTGNNDGVEVEKYLKFVGRGKGDAWCAAFASYNLNAIGITKPINPVSAWAPSFANTKYIVWSQSLSKTHKAQKPQPGDCFTLYYVNLKRVGHVGFIIGETGQYYITTEGNTGISGSREGAGVHRLKRSKSKVFAVTNYITPYLKQHEKHFNLSFILYSNGLLQSKINTGDGKRIPSNRQLICAKGFYLLQGFNYYDSPGQFKNYSHTEAGCKWISQPPFIGNGNATLESKRLSYEWKATSRLYLQVFRTDSTVSATSTQVMAKNSDPVPKGKGRGGHQGSALHTQMG